MVHSLLKYIFSQLLDAKSLSPDVIVYDLPVLTSRNSEIISTPFHLTESKAGEILQKISSDDALTAELKRKLDEAQRVPRTDNATGTHPVDPNLMRIREIVCSVAPHAPTDVVIWFAGLSYEIVARRAD